MSRYVRRVRWPDLLAIRALRSGRDMQLALALLLGANRDYRLHSESLVHGIVRRRLRWAMRIVLKKGAELEVQDADGHTPLVLALLSDDFWAIERLTRAGASWATKNRNGKDASYFAACIRGKGSQMGAVTPQQ